ncbi:MAG TPA: tail fiber protein [Verrucomicrobiae bacterium]
MSQPYVGEIRIVGFSFAPSGWAFCDGALLDISQNDVLFNLIGTTYGGDGQNTFALPNLQSRFPMHMGTGGGGTYVIGQYGGTESETLTTQQMPAHTHVPQANSGAGNSNSPTNAVWANWTGNQYSDLGTSGAMAAASLQTSGGNQPHENMHPYQCVNFVISLYGIFPSQN